MKRKECKYCRKQKISTISEKITGVVGFAVIVFLMFTLLLGLFSHLGY